MALKIEIESPFGVPAEYWNTHDIVISLRERKVSVATNGYRDADARHGNATPMGSKGVSLAIGPVDTGRPDSSFVPFIPVDAVRAIQTAVYEALKTTPEFAGAVDV